MASGEVAGRMTVSECGDFGSEAEDDPRIIASQLRTQAYWCYPHDASAPFAVVVGDRWFSPACCGTQGRSSRYSPVRAWHVARAQHRVAIDRVRELVVNWNLMHSV
jgi:hypothetical protein